MSSYYERVKEREKTLAPITRNIITIAEKEWGVKYCDSHVRIGKENLEWMLTIGCSLPEEDETQPRIILRERIPPRYKSPPPFDQKKSQARIQLVVAPNEALVDHETGGRFDSKRIKVWVRPQHPDHIPFPDVYRLAKTAIGALQKLGSRCTFDAMVNRHFTIDCDHDKDDGVIFQARVNEEDDDFPNFIGRDKVLNAVRAAIPQAQDIGAQDHEKGAYEVSFQF